MGVRSIQLSAWAALFGYCEVRDLPRSRTSPMRFAERTMMFPAELGLMLAERTLDTAGIRVLRPRRYF